MSEKEVIQEAADFIYEALTCLGEIKSIDVSSLKNKLESIRIELEDLAE